MDQNWLSGSSTGDPEPLHETLLQHGSGWPGEGLDVLAGATSPGSGAPAGRHGNTREPGQALEAPSTHPGLESTAMEATVELHSGSANPAPHAGGHFPQESAHAGPSASPPGEVLHPRESATQGAGLGGSGSMGIPGLTARELPRPEPLGRTLPGRLDARGRQTPGLRGAVGSLPGREIRPPAPGHVLSYGPARPQQFQNVNHIKVLYAAPPPLIAPLQSERKLGAKALRLRPRRPLGVWHLAVLVTHRQVIILHICLQIASC
eukprot:jgi/Botrbrau1/3347/Bobra.0048s0041.1